MKAMRHVFVFAGALFAAAGGLAQSEVMGVLKLREQFTTDGTTITAHPFNEYSFESFVNRSGYTGTETVNATPPPLSTGTIGYIFEGDGFNYSKSYTGGEAAAKAALDAEFLNGDYVFNAESDSVTLTLGSDAYPTNPVTLFTLDNGTFTPFFSGGKLWVDGTQNLTITAGTFTAGMGFVSGASFVGVSIEGGANDIDIVENTFNNMSLNTASLIVLSGNILAGGNYNASIEYIRFTEIDTTTISGVTALAGFSTITSFEVAAIPEPSTYAAIFGLAALGGALIYRRRRALA